MLKSRFPSCTAPGRRRARAAIRLPDARAPHAEKPGRRAWLPLAAVILLFLVTRLFKDAVSSGFGSAHGMLAAYLHSLWYRHIASDSALFYAFALFSFVLSGVLWHQSTGRARRIYYWLFAFFAFQYGTGFLFYIFTFTPPFNPRKPEGYVIAFYALWLAFLLAVLVFEFLSRKRR